MPLGAFRINSLAKVQSAGGGGGIPSLSPGWYSYQQASAETSYFRLGRNIAFAGYTSDFKIISTIITNDSNSANVRSFVFDQVNETFTEGSQTDLVAHGATNINTRRIAGPWENDYATAGSTRPMLAMQPASFVSGGYQIFPVTADSTGATTVGTGTTTQIANIGSNDRSWNVSYAGLWNGDPAYLIFGRVGSYVSGATAGNTRLYTYNGSTFVLESAWGSNFTANRTWLDILYNSGSGLGYYTNNGNEDTGFFNWWDGTTRYATADIDPGIRGQSIMMQTGSTAKIITCDDGATNAKCYTVTFGATVPTYTVGSAATLKSGVGGNIGTWRLTRGFANDEAYFFYTDSGKMYVKKITTSGNVITVGSAVELFTCTNVTGVATMDVKTVFDGNDEYFVGFYTEADSAEPEPYRTFVVRYVQ